MKKILSALLAAVLLLSATACAAHEPVLPPSRWGEGESQGMLPHTYSLSEAYDAAEVVALVTVGDWLEEELITGRTFFRTTVQKVYRGISPMSLSWPRRAAPPGPTETIPYSPMAISCCCS